MGIGNEYGVYKIQYELGNMEMKENVLSECLKVINEKEGKKSLSSLVKEIKIRDSVSNKYAKLFDNMKVSSICFIDTRGLDHIEKGVTKESVMQRIFSDEKEEYEKENDGVKNEDGIDAVLYLKKLDSGKPNELSEVIPLVYKISPQIALYTVFTGIDIFYTGCNNCVIDWNDTDTRVPKSVEYIKSDEFKLLLKKVLLARDSRKEIVYNVLSKNIIAFCGSETNCNKFYESNRNNIKKLLKSIIMRENMSVDFIKKESIKKNISSESIGKLIEVLFKEATLMHFGNTNAPATCFNYISGKEYEENSYDFGYYGYYADNKNRLDLCFSNAYNKVFSRGSSEIEEFLKEWPANTDKIESILINMKNIFLGTSISLYKIWQEEFGLDNKDKKIESFIYYIRKLYCKKKERSNFSFDPFNVRDNYYFHTFLEYINCQENSELFHEEHIVELKEKFKEKIENEKNILDQKVIKINDRGIESNLVLMLNKELTYTDKRKLKTLKDDLKNNGELITLADIIFDQNDEMSKSDMKRNISNFMFKSAVYYCNEDGGIDYLTHNNSNISEDLFYYFDQVSIIKGKISLKEKVIELKKKYLQYCFDFKSRLEDGTEVKNKLVEYFIKIFKDEINNDREKCLKNILSVDSDIRNSLKLTRLTIEKLFMNNNSVNDSMCEDLDTSVYIGLLELFVEKLS